MALKKGSKEAKLFMAKIRAKKGVSKNTRKPSRIDDLLLIDEIKGRAKKRVSGIAKKKVYKQTGTSVKEKDKLIQALPVGKRVAKKSKRVYTETRANRSDKGRLLGLLGSMFDYSIINDIDSLKKEYFKLAKKYHPDAGGSTSQFQALQNEYEISFKKLLAGSKLSSDEKKNETIIDEALREVINQIIALEGINIELIGKWLWISGDTYSVKTVLKSAGLIFIKKAGKPYWVYKGVESSGRGKMSMDEIKNKYGSSKIDLKPSKKITGVKSVNKTKLKSALMKLKSALNKRSV